MLVGNISVAKRMIENPRSWLVDWKFDRGSRRMGRGVITILFGASSNCESETYASGNGL